MKVWVFHFNESLKITYFIQKMLFLLSITVKLCKVKTIHRSLMLACTNEGQLIALVIYNTNNIYYYVQLCHRYSQYCI